MRVRGLGLRGVNVFLFNTMIFYVWVLGEPEVPLLFCTPSDKCTVQVQSFIEADVPLYIILCKKVLFL